jgi:hypothetical protein
VHSVTIVLGLGDGTFYRRAPIPGGHLAHSDRCGGL